MIMGGNYGKLSEVVGLLKRKGSHLRLSILGSFLKMRKMETAGQFVIDPVGICEIIGTNQPRVGTTSPCNYFPQQSH
jgi:hypothetical protein